MKTLSVLGSTGSIGRSTLDVARQGGFEVIALTAGSNAELLIEQALEFKPKAVAIADEEKYAQVKSALSSCNIEVTAGDDAIADAAAIPCDITMAAIQGMVGLAPTMAAIEQGNTVAFASKECLVGAGEVMMRAVEKYGTSFLPVDSEHNAIFQVFESQNKAQIERLILTASGGPFRTMPQEKLADVTPEEAVNHPNWSMGAKISVDSATMMNKALELIEAKYLFDMPPSKIDVLVHPQSIIHSMVEYTDGSVLAQLGAPDMRTPIAYCLGYPERIKTPGQKLDLKQMKRLDFEDVDHEKFESISLAYAMMNKGSEYCHVMNTANEIFVAQFLNNEIKFTDIVPNVARICDTFKPYKANTVQDVIDLDMHIRTYINEQNKIRRRA